MEDAERHEAACSPSAKRAAKRAARPKAEALRCYFPKRDATGAVAGTQERVLCPVHRVAVFSTEPTSYGAGERFPAAACETCRETVASGRVLA